MGLSNLQEQYLKVFEQIKPHLDNMKTHISRFYHYKGWADIDSPILSEPDILFIGINRGIGRYKEWGCIPPDYPTPWRSTLHYISDGVARNHEWWHTSNGKRTKNNFPATICELLVRIYRHFEIYHGMSREDLTDVFQQRIMATNVYPLSTENKQQLYALLKQYEKETKVDLRQLCINRIGELIKMVHPKCVVLLGKTVERDIQQVLVDSHYNIPVYTINRKRGWHGRENISKAAEKIYGMISNH